MRRGYTPGGRQITVRPVMYLDGPWWSDHEVIPVESCVTGEVLSHLCLTCDEQLPNGEHPPLPLKLEPPQFDYLERKQ